MVLTGSQHRATGGSIPVLLWNGEAFGKADKNEDEGICVGAPEASRELPFILWG